MPALQPIAPAPDCGSHHRPSRSQTNIGDVRRARCLDCGLGLMRTAISRRWIIADQLG